MPDNKNTTNQNEFELPTPHKKRDDITTTRNTDESTDIKNKQEDKKITTEDEDKKNPDNPAAEDAEWTQDKLNEANNQKGDQNGNGNADRELEGVLVNGKGDIDENAAKVDKEAYVSDKNKQKGNLDDTSKDSIIEKPKNRNIQ
jgi:hypothetical protein